MDRIDCPTILSLLAFRCRAGCKERLVSKPTCAARSIGTHGWPAAYSTAAQRADSLCAALRLRWRRLPLEYHRLVGRKCGKRYLGEALSPVFASWQVVGKGIS